MPGRRGPNVETPGGPVAASVCPMRLLALVLAVGLFATFPSVSAGAGACSDEATATLGDHYLYVGPALVEVWHEQNGHPGLQRSACTDENGRDVQPDLLVA